MLDFLWPSELIAVRRQLDDQKMTQAVLRTEYPLGYALLYIDGKRELREAETVTAPRLTVDWSKVQLVALEDDTIEVTWPHIRATSPDGAPTFTITGQPSVRLGLYPPQTVAFQTPALELWARVMMTEPRVVFVIGLKPVPVKIGTE
jgi:hypothetical protein